MTLDEDRRQLRERWYQEGWYQGRTFAEELRAGARRFGSAEMVFHSRGNVRRTTLAESFERSERVAAKLQQLGVGAGDVVAVQVPNWLEGVMAYQAAMLVGAVIVPIIHIYGPAEVGFILRQSGAKVLIVPDRWGTIDYLDRLRRTELGSELRTVVVIGDDVPSGYLPWSQLEVPTAEIVHPAPRPDDVCVLIYTSGTTAEPKGVQHSHNSLLAELRGMGHWSGEDDVTLASFPAGHIAGVLGMVRPFMYGSKNVLMDSWDAEDAAALVARHRVTSTSGTPYHLRTLLDAAERGGNDISSLKRYLIGAAAVPPSLVERADRAGISCYRSYGSTEHPTVSSGDASDPLTKRASTDGHILPGNEVRIVDHAGRDVPPGSDGEVAVRGPEQFVGYRDDDLDRASFLRGAWFLTGDIGHLDGDGFLTITDRKKDIIIRGGENISSKEVEDIMGTHPSVRESAAVAFPDPLLGERVCLVATLEPGATLSLDDVKEHFRLAGVAVQKTPERLEIVSELPRTAAGKVKKFELRRALTSVDSTM